ncbi:MAG: hypothetical protein V4692_08095 [Bdellovibrionota bacterium]
MATKLKHQSTGENVVAMPTRCGCEGCNKRTEVMNFCQEHFGWFKFGLITKEGKKPVDFDKKFQAYKKHAA